MEYIIKQESTMTRVARYWRKGGNFVLSKDYATRIYSLPYAQSIVKYEKIANAKIEEVE